MIGRLTGLIVERALDGACVVDVGGVGYEVYVPASSASALPMPPSIATLAIHTQVREDAITLYGFQSERDREVFRAILSVSGVGPRIALSILSSLTVDDLAAAVARADGAALKGVSGVGKKIAERLLLELKDKLPATSLAIPNVRRTQPPTPTGPAATILGALVQMGYKPSQAEAAVARLGDTSERPVEELLRDALAHLA